MEMVKNRIQSQIGTGQKKLDQKRSLIFIVICKYYLSNRGIKNKLHIFLHCPFSSFSSYLQQNPFLPHTVDPSSSCVPTVTAAYVQTSHAASAHTCRVRTPPHDDTPSCMSWFTPWGPQQKKTQHTVQDISFFQTFSVSAT